MRDFEIREVLKEYLRDLHAHEESLILDEVGLLNGASRADLVLINGAINGYEIKSDRDTLNRLRSQKDSYSECFETITIVVGQKHLGSVRKAIPSNWGVILVTDENGQIQVRNIRPPKHNKKLKLASCLRLLWKSELEQAVRSFTVEKIGRETCSTLIEILINSCSEDQILEIVRTTLKHRGDWRVGPTPFRCGDSLQSSARSQRSQKNRSWLLSLKFEDRQN